MQLSREGIVTTAVDILDEYGLADVSMRRIASTLGVAPGALYWHVENKQELIAAMAAAIVAPVVAAPPADPEVLSGQLRELVLGVRDGAEVVVAAIGQTDAPVRRQLTDVFTTAVRASVPATTHPQLVDAAAHGLLHLTLGAAAVEQSGTQLAAATGDAAPGDSAAARAARHTASVRLLLTGLAQSARSAQSSDGAGLDYDLSS